MKNLISLFFLCFTLISSAQEAVKVNFLTGVNYNHADYSYIPMEGLSDSVNYSLPLGYQSGIFIEIPIEENLAFEGGIQYEMINYRPALFLQAWYGAILGVGDDQIYMNRPYLDQHKFHLVTIPFRVKKYFKSEGKISWFCNAGMSIGLKFKESEIYRDLFYFGIGGNDFPEKFKDTDRNFGLFNSSIDLGAGCILPISERFSLIMQADVAFLDYRRPNEKHKKNGDMLWEDNLVIIGQSGFSIGIQYNLRHTFSK